MKHIIGIDFGTSTSMIKTAIRDGNADSLETKPVTFTQQGIGSTPTLIRRLGDIVWYGFEAEQNERQDAPLVRNFKLGLRSENPEERKQAIAYIEEFYAYLYEQYQEQKSFLFGTAPGEKETWVSYPVQWSEEQRRVVLDAARKAGFPNVKGLDEPTAAVICILKAKQKELEKSGLLCRETPLNAMVLDMGAGTTDLAFITVTVDGQGLHTTLRGIWPEAGSPYIYGGGQMDARLEEMLEEWVKGCGISTAKSMVAGQRCAIKRWKENAVSPLLAQGQTISDFSGISTILNTMAQMMGLPVKPFPGLSKDSFFERFSPELQSFVKVISSAPQALRDETDLVILTGGNSEWFWVRDILLGKETRFGDVGLKEIKGCPQKVIRMDQPAETVSRGLVYDRNIVVVSPPKKEAVKQVPKPAPVKPAAPIVPIGDLTGSPSIPILRIGGYDSESGFQTIIAERSASELARGERLLVFDGKKGRNNPEALKGTAVLKAKYLRGTETVLYIQPEGRTNIGEKDILVCTSGVRNGVAEPVKADEQTHTELKNEKENITMAENVLMYNIRSGKTIGGAVEAVRTYFHSENMETQYFLRNDCHIVQARVKSGKLKQLVGLDKAIEVRFTPVNNNSSVTVEIGGAKWADKAAVMATSMFILWPLAITAGIGIYGQSQVTKKAKKVIEAYFNS